MSFARDVIVGEPVNKTSSHSIVLEAFKAFDCNGNGVIEPRELKAIFQILDPKKWSDRTIRRLLRNVDTNDDGNIQLAEFVHWVFAQGPHGDNLKLCRSAIFATSKCNLLLTRPEHAELDTVEDPPQSVDDQKVHQYLLDPSREVWRVQVVGMDMKQKTGELMNGLRLDVDPACLADLDGLLGAVPHGRIVAMELTRTEAKAPANVVIVDFEIEHPSYPTAPPKNAEDPVLKVYLDDHESEGWFVEVRRFNEETQEAILRNGQPVAVRRDQVSLLQKLLRTVPSGQVVCGLLLEK